MLRSFRMANHRSFRDEHELSLIPAYDRGRPAVPVAALYGANASGKSNLLDGLDFMCEAVMYSFRTWDPDGGVPRHSFRLDPAVRDEPSTFVVELVVDGVRYTYGFVVGDREVLNEWLYSYPEKRKRVLFEREGQDVKFGTTVADQRAKLDLLEELTRPNALFLSVAAQSSVGLVMPVYRWFYSDVRLRRAGDALPDPMLAARVRLCLEQGESNKARFMSLLTAADIGISGISIQDEADPLRAANMRNIDLLMDSYEGQLKEADSERRHEILNEVEDLHRLRKNIKKSSDVLMPRLRFSHGDAESMFDLSDESSGTRSWTELLPVVLDVLDNGHLMLVDEIDASLHPLLTARLVGLFRDDETNPNGAQLVFTTHDASLLGTMLGEEVLGRDQVWFVEKNADGASSLYPLTDFKPRTGENTERRYLGGSYGAVPVLSAHKFSEAVRGR